MKLFVWIIFFITFCNTAYRKTTENLLLGISTHIYNQNIEKINSNIYYTGQLKFEVVRWDAPWKIVEESQGILKIPTKWDYAVDNFKRQGADSILILDYGNKFYDGGNKPLSDDAIKAYVRYASFVVNHFKGRVKYYEIWNEWNGRLGNTDHGKASDYVRLLKAVYPVLKSIDKNIVIIGGSFSSSSYDSLLGIRVSDRFMPIQFESLMKLDFANFVDAIGIHPYVVYRDSTYQSYEGFITLLHKVVNKIRESKGFENKQIFITEVGWSTAINNRNGVNDSIQKEFIIKSIEESKKLGISMLVLYSLFDDGQNSSEPENNFGLLRYDHSEKPIFQYLKDRER